MFPLQLNDQIIQSLSKNELKILQYVYGHSSETCEMSIHEFSRVISYSRRPCSASVESSASQALPSSSTHSAQMHPGSRIRKVSIPRPRNFRPRSPWNVRS